VCGTEKPLLQYDLYNPPRGVSIPQRGPARGTRPVAQDMPSCTDDPGWVNANNLIAAMLDRRWPFGIVAQREARHT